MASATVKVLLVALAFVATAAIARADGAPKVDAANLRSKHIILYPNNTARTGSCGPLATASVVTRNLAETATSSRVVGTLYQSGICVNSTAPLLNVQGTIVLKEGYDFPAGKIFYVGDEAGVQLASGPIIFSQKSIVGGTGPYTHAEGKITLSTDKTFIIITIFNW